MDSGPGSSGPQGERGGRPRAAQARPGIADERPSGGDPGALDRVLPLSPNDITELAEIDGVADNGRLDCAAELELGPEFDDDDLAIVALLAQLTDDTAPDGDARARMRTKVLAGMGESLAETGTDPTPDVDPLPVREPDRPLPRPVRSSRSGRAPRGRRDSAPGPPKPSPTPRTTGPGTAAAAKGTGVRGRFAVAATAALLMVFALTGMSLLLARDALPGDALYGVKRTGEAASLGLTFGDEQKAFKHLEFATARITEIETLAQRYTDPGSAPTTGYLAALGDFDNDATAGTRALTALGANAGGQPGGERLEALRGWADQQGARLAALRPRLPGGTDNQVSASLTLLDRIEGRASSLLARLACYQVSSGDLDEIGTLPATGTCDPRPDAPRVLVPPSGTEAGGSPAPDLTDPAAPPTTGPPPSRPSGQTTAPAPPRTTTPPPLISLPPLIGTTKPAPGTTTTAPPLVTVPLPLPLPTIEVPPLLPGLGGIRIG
ncbi:DUF5667 domain-containing protein [Actinokineospora enzanensis]|uniref:DUF5667 domain-containing protein n=1 Tax=Actinokineospora enzanensis TaxID=155975 RepID=UPI00039E07C2|nr:DUF5667 domain-containing protein [Actinokineospora enzanensis]